MGRMKTAGERPHYTVALVGNPNVGKSTLFNCLTGMEQHTGNWPGKTVSVAEGIFRHKGKTLRLIDLPGTYSLVSKSPEEQVTADFLSSGAADCVLVVCDATCLERNLHLALQLLAKNTVLCLNLMDEAERAGISVDVPLLRQELGIPIVPTAARAGKGLDRLKDALLAAAEGGSASHFSPSDNRVFTGTEEEKEDFFTAYYSKRSREIAEKVLVEDGQKHRQKSSLDRLLLGRWSGGFCMLLLLMGVLWLTVKGANLPSAGLQLLFDSVQYLLWRGASALRLPLWLSAPLLDGVYATTAQVVAVMLPPMAIFFPIFAILEDFGFLPRVAFLLDRPFERCGSCGKQALTMCMGLGCNTAGVTGCRIVDSPRERKIAILTNALVPCNGRFPLLIVLISLFFTKNSIAAAAALTALLMLSVLSTFLLSAVLSKTFCRGETSSFAMELPPFRRPRVLQVLWRSLRDKTLHILLRAVVVAAPAGLILWCAVNLPSPQQSLLHSLCGFLDPFGRLLGVDGVILSAFLLAFPANELVLPIILTALGGSTEMALLVAGWTWKTALCTMLLCLFHFPCSTTCLTVWKETKSISMTLGAILLPTVYGILLCLVVNGIFP